jgi:hypothetical protein
LDVHVYSPGMASIHLDVHVYSESFDYLFGMDFALHVYTNHDPKLYNIFFSSG